MTRGTRGRCNRFQSCDRSYQSLRELHLIYRQSTTRIYSMSGEQDASWVLYGRHNGKRFAVYVPEDLAPQVQRAVENARALEDLLMQAGPRYVKALKRARASEPKRRRK
jgi:hypothetical protein